MNQHGYRERKERGRSEDSWVEEARSEVVRTSVVEEVPAW